MVIWQDGQQTIAGVPGLPTQSMDSTGLGNVRVTPKVGLLEDADGRLGLSFLLHVLIPVAQKQGYFGDGSFDLQPELAFSARIGDLRLAANGAYRWRSKSPVLVGTSIRDELSGRAGAALRFGAGDDERRPFEVALSISGATAARTIFDLKSQDAAVLLGQVLYDFTVPLTGFVGGGTGLLPAYGVPDFQLFGGVRWTGAATPPPPPAPVDDDPDRDGVRGPSDRCPTEPEDIDGFEDADGCPDPDNDGDKVPDASDECPNVSGPADNKGCPDADADGDGVVDRLDRCPTEAEDADGFQDDDGCPDPDNDGDGVADGQDRCPGEVGPKDNQGCPDPDRDGDGIVDRLDNCPDEAGTPENAGCKAKQLARITEGGIEIGDTVYFKVDKAVIQRKSFGLLENVARIISSHPEAGTIRVEGHTDSRGNAAHNQDLSERRAAAVVDFLVQKGVPRDRLVAKGFGSTQPIADERTAAGRAKNRRVVFAKEPATQETRMVN